MNVIILAGSPGAGKTTLRKEFLEKNYKIPTASAGHILRTTTTGKIKEMVDQGIDVPEKIVNSKMFNKISSVDKIILDGYPIKLEQVKFLEEQNVKIKGIIHINPSSEHIWMRLKERMENDERASDKVEFLEDRIKRFNKNGLPMIEYLKNKGTPYIELNGGKKIPKEKEILLKELMENFISR